MEGVLSTKDKQNLVSSFLEIAVGQTPETALQFLQVTSWKLEEAIQLFYVGNEMGGPITEQLPSSSTCGGNAIKANEPTSGESREDGGKEPAGQNVGDRVRAPLPAKREVLYDDVMLYPLGSSGGNPSHETVSFAAVRDFVEEMKRPAVWESEQGPASTAENPRNNLASLYRPPFHLMFQGSFEKAKALASMEDKWLLVNLQSTKEFSSHMLNRDTWANEAVSQTISTNFIFWQVCDDTSEGRKVCTYYRLDSTPVVLVIDPITGQNMKSWGGMIQPESLLENLLPFMDGGPKDHHLSLSHKRPQERCRTPPQNFRDVSKEEDKEMQEALAASLEAMKEDANDDDDDDAIEEEEEPPYSSSTKPPKFPPLPEEPKEEDRSLLCRVRVRLPNGSRVQRNFLLTNPIQLLWSFCNSQLGDGEGGKLFQLTQAIPGASRRSLDYDSNLTFEESGLANSMISITWE